MNASKIVERQLLKRFTILGRKDSRLKYKLHHTQNRSVGKGLHSIIVTIRDADFTGIDTKNVLHTKIGFSIAWDDREQGLSEGVIACRAASVFDEIYSLDATKWSSGLKKLLEDQPMRVITGHKVNGLNEAILIEAIDEPGAGGACHEYSMTVMNDGVGLKHVVRFQKGPVQEAGYNGFSNEALLAIVEDRLEGFESGEFACFENGMALLRLREAIHWLHKRTKDRVARGVEGTSKV